MGELRMSKLIDTYGREHRNLRVSLTDRCSLRCTYCMPNDFAAWIPNDDLLTSNELLTVIEVAVEQGINEVRLTGGEPLLRARLHHGQSHQPCWLHLNYLGGLIHRSCR